jgi:hypothetical protein
MRAALRFRSFRVRSGRPSREQTPVDQVACDEIQARIPAIIAALGHDEAVLFLERCIVAIQKDQEDYLCKFLEA